MVGSWIAQIGEEDLSETEAVDSIIARMNSANEFGLRFRWFRCSRRRFERIVDFSHHVQEECFRTDETVIAPISESNGRRRNA